MSLVYKIKCQAVHLVKRLCELHDKDVPPEIEKVIAATAVSIFVYCNIYMYKAESFEFGHGR